MSAGQERKALGRGLAALLGGEATVPPPAKDESKPTQTIVNPAKSAIPSFVTNSAAASAASTAAPSPYQILALTEIEANPEQPRKIFNEEKIRELSESIKDRGLVQPIIVRREASTYRIIAGERRFRAAKLAGLEKIPVIVRQDKPEQVDDDLNSIVENIQREDLNALELSIAYDRILKKYSYTQEKLAQKLGISRVSLANTLRLLNLPDTVKQFVKESKISEGHARALLALEKADEMEEMAKHILQSSLSVRDTENLVRMKKLGAAAKAAREAASEAVEESENAPIKMLEEELRRLFGTKAVIHGGGQRGTIELYYTNPDSLNRLLHQLRGTKS